MDLDKEYMAGNNDAKIKELLGQIEAKKVQVGTKPRAVWKTNGLIGESKTNINTINSLATCLELATEIFQKQIAREQAATFLELGEEREISSTDELDDLKLRVSIIKYDIEKKKLTTLEAKLKDLRSNDAKTEDAIEELASLL